MKSERVVILGLQGSGKSVFARHLARRYVDARRGVLVFDPLHELHIDGASHYYPKDRTHPTAECEKLIEKAIFTPYRNGVPLSQRYQLFIVDEVSRVYPHSKPFPPHMGLLNDTLRHAQLSLVTISRRAVQQHVDFLELAHTLVIFHQSGKNDLERLEDVREGLGDMVSSLRGHEHVIYRVGTDPVKMDPIPLE